MKLISNGRGEFENKELDEKPEHVRNCEDGVVIVGDYEKLLKKSCRNDIISIARKQG